MFGMIIAALATAAISGTVAGVNEYKAETKKASAYKDAAKDVKAATKKHSGSALYNDMMNIGIDQAVDTGNAMGNELAASDYTPTNPGVTGAGANTAAYQNAANNAYMANEAANKGLDEGMNYSANRNAALYGAKTTQAQQLAKQADIDYKVANQATQEGLGAMSDIAKTANSMRRTNNGRNYAGQ